MFAINQKRLVGGLERIRRTICLYNRDFNGGCDCKYGASLKRLGKDEGMGYAGRHDVPMFIGFNGEECGCCEIFLATLLVLSLTPKEYKEHLKRIGAQLSSEREDHEDSI